MTSSRFSRTSIGIVTTLLALAAPTSFAADEGEAPAPAPAIDPSVSSRLDALDQQVKILGRKLEIAQEESAAKAKDGAVVKAGPDGFALAANDGSFSLKIGGYAQVDGKFYLTDEDKPSNNTFYISRARIIFDGVLGPYVAFRIMPEFAPGRANLADAYVQLKLWPEAVVQAGRFKLPVGLERLQSDANLLFIERSLASGLTPDRDTGLQLGGTLGGKLDYAVGIFNGPVDNANRDADVNDAKEAAGRLFLTPFKNGEAWISGLAFGVGGSIGQDEGTVAAQNLPVYKTAGQSNPGNTGNVFAWRNGGAVGTTTVATGWHWRVDPQAYWYSGPFGLQGEYILTGQDLTIGGSRSRLNNSGWVGQVGWVLTGENASFQAVKPAHPFDLKSGSWGAWEIGARISRLDIDNDAFPVYADPTKAVRSATSYGAALNWYLTRNLKVQTDYEFTRFEGGAAAGANERDLQSEHVIESQIQVSF